MDTLTSANNHARGSSGGVNVTVAVEKGAFQVGSLGGANSVSDVEALGDMFTSRVDKAMAKINLMKAVASGNTG